MESLLVDSFQHLCHYVTFPTLHNIVDSLVGNKASLEKIKHDTVFQYVYINASLNWIRLMKDEDDVQLEDNDDDDEEGTPNKTVKKEYVRLGLISDVVSNQQRVSTSVLGKRKTSPSTKENHKKSSKLSSSGDVKSSQTKKASKEVGHTDAVKHQLWLKFSELFGYVRKGLVKILGPEQTLALEKVLSGRKVFVTGPPGTGKSLLIGCFKRYYDDTMIVTAPTGIAACNVGGSTIHRVLSLNNNVVKSAEYRISQDEDELWKCRMFLVDEVSMLGKKDLETASYNASYLFTARKIHLQAYGEGNKRQKGKSKKIDIEAVVKTLKEDITTPFGNRQVVFLGDFHQLPPVNDAYCFTSPLWSKLDMEVIHLTRNYRQSSDDRWRLFLERVRSCNVNRYMIEWINKRHVKNSTFPDRLPNGIFSNPPQVDSSDVVFVPKSEHKEQLRTSICLTALNSEAEQINNQFISCLKTEEHVFESEDSIYDKSTKRWMKLTDEKTIASGFTMCKFLQKLTLKVGARVMINFNLNKTLVNGRMGTVEKIHVASDDDDDGDGDEEMEGEKEYGEKKKKKKSKDYVTVRLDQDGSLHTIEKITWTSAPVKELKNQAEQDNSTFFSLDKWLDNSTGQIKKPSDLLNHFGNFLESNFDEKGRPVVSAGGRGGMRNIPNKAIRRVQFPLQLAWGISIHKSQSMTLDRVTIKGGKCFAEGQIYVALSRCRSYNGIYLLDDVRFEHFKSSHVVNKFYKDNHVV